ncbi:MAG: hypothetical protein Q8R08_05120 [bacterium]|nr:hypothetical protein [bacterium]
MFDPEQIYTTHGRDELARVIAETLDADLTEPIPDRDQWLGETALRRLESRVVQTEQLYSEFAVVCEHAHKIASRADVRELLRLGTINGLRRFPEDKLQDKLIRGLVAVARDNINELEESPRKHRLLSLWAYHAGIYASVIGDYRLAAESQDLSANLVEAAGDMKAAVISTFRGSVERVNDALVNHPEKVRDAMARMSEAGEKLKEALGSIPDDPTSARWLLLNLPLHNLTSHFWVNETYDGTNDYRLLKELAFRDPKLALTEAASIAVAYAIHALNLREMERASQLATAVIEDILSSRPLPMYIATAHLIHARIAQARAGGDEEAKLHLQAATKVKGEAHQVRAIADRMLKL